METETKNLQACDNCISGRDGKTICIVCGGSGYIPAVPLEIQCEHVGCNRMGKDYQPNNGGEPSHLCRIHAIPFKLKGLFK